MPNYLEHLLFLLAFYLAAGVSLSWSVRYAGIVSLFGGCVLALGAYAAAYVTNWTSGAWIVLLAAAAGAGGLLLAVVFLCLGKLRGDWFVIGSLAVQVVVVDLLYNLQNITNGAIGLSFACRVEDGCLDRSHVCIALTALAALILAVHVYLRRCRFLGQLSAMRDNEDLFRWLGFDPAKTRIALGMLTGTSFAVIGFLYGSYFRFVDPAMFDVRISVGLLLVVIVGGGEFWGAIYGALVVLGLQEGLRLVPINSAGDAFLREVALGGALAFVVFYRVASGRDVFSGGRGVSL